MRRSFSYVAAMFILGMTAFAMMGAVPQQGGVPPQPFLADFYSGKVFVQGWPAPFGAQLMACVDDCATGFQSQPVFIGLEGTYQRLEINPSNRRMKGRDVFFYLVNEHGRIQAQQTAVFEGAFNVATLALTFSDPMPTAPVAPLLPAVGDPWVPELPKVALAVGSLSLATGLGLTLARRRRAV